ncbi:MAG TPA: histidine kinase [Usitatibacter sp.]|nr:histidine kinase [Usitatibacter sp.]
MKSASDILHRTPWSALLAAGLLLAVGLALFVTPFHLNNLEKSGSTPEERQAIKHEVDLTFSEGAIDIAKGVVREMRDRTHDQSRREELDQALADIEEARHSLREAGAEALRAKREGAQTAVEAAREAARAIREAQVEAARAMKEAGADPKEIQKSLDEAIAGAKRAEDEAKREAEAPATPPPLPGLPPLPGTPLPGIPPIPGGTDAAKPGPAVGPHEGKGRGRRIVIQPLHEDKPLVKVEIDPRKPEVTVAPLPPEMRHDIREKVQGDMYKIGLGAGLILLFIPLFILAVVAKFFIDRARGAQKVAEHERREAEYHRMSQQVTEAKLSALQAQVEPHFLYNTLASVQALTEVDPQQANAMTGHLIQYLRNALPKMRESVSTVGQEIELVRAYLNILQMRMGKRLAFDISVPPELLDAPFPPLMLPSLVENSIKHGLEPQREGGKVTITGESIGDRLRLTVTDTGRGFSEAPGQGVGLTNIRERLAALYGDAAKLTLEANDPQGVRATIEVPRAGARAAAASNASAAWAGAASAPPPPPSTILPPRAATAAARTLAAMGSAERMWRKSLSFAFIGLVVVAAVLAGLGIVGVTTGLMPVNIGDQQMDGATGALIGTAGIAIAFCVVVLGLAIVLAVVYGLGFIFVGLAIFIPLVIIVSLFPALSPFILLGLIVWWFVRRSKQQRATATATPSPQPPAAP